MNNINEVKITGIVKSTKKVQNYEFYTVSIVQINSYDNKETVYDFDVNIAAEKMKYFKFDDNDTVLISATISSKVREGKNGGTFKVLSLWAKDITVIDRAPKTETSNQKKYAAQQSDDEDLPF
jgi:PBP1b-binding outer membrane lipoprotein LpoB